jgi:uncharacterized protein (TIGR02653 family)
MTLLDELDRLAAEAFEGYLVKKDLAQQFRGQYPVPTYVGEFLLGRYCATTDPDEIDEGLEIVRRSMSQRTVRPGEEELFKSRAREKGAVKVIDLLRARLDARTDSYKAELPSLQLKDAHISSQLVNEHDRVLTGGFYAEVTLEYIAALADEQGGSPFRIEAIRPIQMSTHGALDTFIEGRRHFTLEQWRGVLLRSVGFELEQLTNREQDILLARMIPFVMNNYNAVELGPRGTGKSHLYQQVSPYAHLISGGRASIANMFVHMGTGKRGLVAQYDVICFDEISGVHFDSKEGVNMLKGYMESGEFSRGRESIKATGGIVMVGNFEVDVNEQLRQGHLLQPLPKDMRDNTALMDRIHAFLPGWDVPKLDPSYFTEHFGFVSDFLAECWTHLRHTSRLDAIRGRIRWGRQLSGRDRKAAENTINGLLKLLYPDPEMEVPAEFLTWAAELAVECRRRVKEQQAFVGEAEFGAVDLSFSIDGGPEQAVYCDESGRPRAERAAESKSVPKPDKLQPSDKALPKPDDHELTGDGNCKQHEYGKGEFIGGRFEVVVTLGSGGFSTVYQVLDMVEEEQRALKLFWDASGYQAVRREIAALRKVNHPNVVDVFWADRTDRGEWYLVMELVDGEPLQHYTSGQKHLRDREAVDIILEVLNALAAIHPDSVRLNELEDKKRDSEITPEEFDEMQGLQEAGLVHRDIKPHNIVLTRQGAKLLDFNIASRVGDPVNTVSGTPPYQPPEAELTRWDVSTDLFAVGVMLYELLCEGEHPYPGSRPRGGEEVRDPHAIRLDLDEQLATFVQRACSPYRETRFHTAVEMREALRAIRASI